MEPTGQAAPPRGRRRRILTLVLAVVLVASALVVAWLVLRPWSIAQVFGLSHYQPGSQITVAGTITGIFRENTSYGPRVGLQLDGNSLCYTGGDVLGDPNETYRVGDAFQTTLHFQAYTFNGDPVVSAPELACPFPAVATAITTVMDAVSQVAGMVLGYNGTQAGGWIEYEIVAQNGLPYNESFLPVTLRKVAPILGSDPGIPAGTTIDSSGSWIAFFAVEYVRASGGFTESPIVDRMASLSSASSTNGSLRFIDANQNRMVDDGDHLDVRLPPTAATSAWDTYFLQVGTWLGSAPTYAAGVHYLLNGPDGPLETLASSKPTSVDLQYAGDRPGPPIQTTVEVTRVPFGAPPPVSRVVYNFDVDGELLSGNLAALPASTPAGVLVSFVDSNADGLLDPGDRLTLSGVVNRSAIHLNLREGEDHVGYIHWIVGYGQPYHFIPNVSFAVQGSGPWTITADVPSWSPELALNRTLRASLFENGLEVVANASLVTGTIGTFTNGTLGFTDADGNGFLSTGDAFTLHGDPAGSYELQVSILFTNQIPRVYV